MTGFGSSRTTGAEELSVEIRSVNGKFCEVRARMPRELASLEPGVVARIKQRVARGTIDLSVRRGAGAGPERELQVDEALAERVAERLRALQQRLQLAGELRLSDVTAVDGVLRLEERALDLDAVEQALLAALDEALDRLIEMREREGEALQSDLSARLQRLAALVEQIAERANEAPAELHARIRDRVQELLADMALDPARVAQEAAFLAERADISEELTRLRSHLEQMETLMRSTEPAGRRMDFLIQEMNREANTIASKATWLPNAHLVVEMKAEIERLREQVQNVE